MFKKEYKELNPEYKFAVYLTLEDDLIPDDGIVYLGQGKSTFLVSFKEEENKLNDQIKSCLRDDVVYFWGDAFVSESVYESVRFAVTKTKTYRTFRKNKNKVSKGTKLYNIISAGSIVIPKNKNEFIHSVSNDNVNLVGYNELIAK